MRGVIKKNKAKKKGGRGGASRQQAALRFEKVGSFFVVYLVFPFCPSMFELLLHKENRSRPPACVRACVTFDRTSGDQAGRDFLHPPPLYTTSKRQTTTWVHVSKHASDLLHVDGTICSRREALPVRKTDGIAHERRLTKKSASQPHPPHPTLSR